MADPVLDEDLMVDLIGSKPEPEMVQRLMAGAMMLLVDAYDRKVTRNDFCTVANAAVALHGYAAQYGGICTTQALLRDGKLTEQTLADTIATLEKLVGRCAERSTEFANRLRECPLSTDKVH